MDTKQLDELLALHGNATAPGTGTDVMWSLCDAAFKHFPSLISQAREAIALRDESERLRAEVERLAKIERAAAKVCSGWSNSTVEASAHVYKAVQDLRALLAPTPEVQR